MPHERELGKVGEGHHLGEESPREQLGAPAQAGDIRIELASRLCERLRVDYIWFGFALPDARCLRNATPAGGGTHHPPMASVPTPAGLMPSESRVPSPLDSMAFLSSASCR